MVHQQILWTSSAVENESKYKDICIMMDTETLCFSIYLVEDTLSLSLISHHLISTNICSPCNVQKRGYNVTALSLSLDIYLTFCPLSVVLTMHKLVEMMNESVLISLEMRLRGMYLLNWLVAHASTPHCLQRTGFQSLKTHQLGM